MRIPDDQQRGIPQSGQYGAVGYSAPMFRDKFSTRDIRVPAPVDRSGEGDTLLRAGQMLGEIGDKARRDAERAYQERVDYDASKAKASYIQSGIAARQKILNTPDYSKHEELFRKTMQEEREKALKLVNDPRRRELLNMDFDVSDARSLLSIQEDTKRKQAQDGRQDLENLLSSVGETLLRTEIEDERTALLKSVRSALRGASAKGWITEPDTVKLSQSFSREYATNRAALLPADARVNLLKPSGVDENGMPVYGHTGTWVDHIPVENRAKLYNTAAEKVREDSVYALSQEIRASASSLKDQISAAREIKDPEIADGVVRQLERMNKTDEMARTAENHANEDLALQHILSGESLRTLDEGVWRSLTKKQKERLFDVEEERLGISVKGPGDRLERDIYFDKLSREYGQDGESILKYSPLDLARKLNPDDYEKVSMWRQEASAGEAVSSATVGQMNAIIEDAVSGMGIRKSDNERSALFRRRFLEDVASYERTSGRKPSPEDLYKISDRLTMEIVFDGPRWWDKRKLRRFEAGDIGPDDARQIVVPENERTKILQKIQERDPRRVVSEEDIKEIYLNMTGITNESP